MNYERHISAAESFLRERGRLSTPPNLHPPPNISIINVRHSRNGRIRQMPSSRNRRRAQSQAQLSGRRRNRGGRRQRANANAAATSEIRTARRPDADATAANGSAQIGATSVAASEAAMAPTPETANLTRRRGARARTPAEPLQMYPYLRSELTRIGALTAMIAVALVALTFVLG